jgi:NAD(P)-dependent dehydrogenase (short-subunit alcohol dehydrogenase family)
MRSVVVISGGSRGIGRACVEVFAEAGYDVAFCARNAEQLSARQALLEQRYPSQRFLGMAADVRSADEIRAFAAAVEQKWEKVDVLINNAGAFLPGSVHDEAEGQLMELLELNLMSAYHLSRALIPRMKKTGAGYIINMSSVAGMQAYPAGGSYSISKFALSGFSKALRLELMSFGIRVTTVYPGATYTDSWSGAGLPESRFIPAEELARVLLSFSELSAASVPEDLLIRPLLGDI